MTTKQLYSAAREIEIALAKWLDPRRLLIVPNVSWGMGLHECDLLVLSRRGYATEIEIKVSRADLLRDKSKRHQHKSDMIKYLYFAVPIEMRGDLDEIPLCAGILLVNHRGKCKIARKARGNPTARRFIEMEQLKLARLGVMRMWALKEQITRAQAADLHGPPQSESN